MHLQLFYGLGVVDVVGDCVIEGSAEIKGNADIADQIKIGGYTIVGGKVKLRGTRTILNQDELMAYIDERREARNGN